MHFLDIIDDFIAFWFDDIIDKIKEKMLKRQQSQNGNSEINNLENPATTGIIQKENSNEKSNFS